MENILEILLDFRCSLTFRIHKSEMSMIIVIFAYYQPLPTMTTDNGDNKGYVYILTNPSFREDWIKIGKTNRPVEYRLKELDTTAVPLPFEIYATMKTASYNEVEAMLHKFLEGTHHRIRKNREFFNVKPEVALDAFCGIAKLLRDAEVYLGGKAPSETNTDKQRAVKAKPSKKKSNFLKSNVVEVHPLDELPKGARYSLDGDNFYSMAKFGHVFIKQLLADDPSLTFQQLETLFPKSMLGNFQYCGVVVRESDIRNAAYPPEAKMKRYRYGDSNYLLCSSDGISFYTSTQWERDSFKKLLSVAERHGYRVFINKA